MYVEICNVTKITLCEKSWSLMSKRKRLERSPKKISVLFNNYFFYKRSNQLI